MKEEEVESVFLGFDTMNIGGEKETFWLGQACPYMFYDYIEDDQQKVAIDFLVPTVAKENFVLKMSPNGMELLMSIKMPLFFVDQTRLLTAHQSNRKFSKNSGKAIAFAECMKKIHAVYGGEDGGSPSEIVGPPQKIKLPFKCDADVTVDKETLNFDMDDEELKDDLEGNEQFFQVLAVELESVVKPRKVKSKKARRIIRSPMPKGSPEDFFAE